MVFSFMLVWVVLNVATTKSTENNSFYGLAIGFTVLAGAAACQPISGAFFNPAIALGGGWFTDCTHQQASGRFRAVCYGGSIWIYVCAPLAGAILAAAHYKFSGRHDMLTQHLLV